MRQKNLVKPYTLIGGTQVDVDISKVDKCRSCGRIITWGRTLLNDKWIPIERAGNFFQSHFASCPDAQKWRKGSQDKMEFSSE